VTARKDEAVDLIDPGAFATRARASLSRGETCLILIRVLSYDDVRGQHGDKLAGRMIDLMIAQAAGALRAGDALSALPGGRLALLVETTLEAAHGAAQRMHAHLRENSRFPVATGAASSKGLAGGYDALLELAEKATEECAASSGRLVYAKTASSSTSARAEPASSPVDDGLEGRYQRLILLNRMSLELLGDKPFPAAIESAATLTLALLGAQHVAFYFCDDLGLPVCELKHGDRRFLLEDAQREERDIMRRAFAQGGVVAASTERGWLAAPLPRPKNDAGPEGGVLVAGWIEPQAENASRSSALADAARLIRNARILHRDLRRRGALAAVTEQSPDAIFTTDPQGRVISWNSSAQRLFGYTRAEIVGRDCHILVPEDRRDETARHEQAGLDDSKAERFESARRRKDGSLVQVEVSYTALRDEHGEPIGLVRIFRDITQRKQLERMRSELISLVTHELRTPLTAISGFAEALYEDPDVDLERRKTYLKVVVDESHRLSKLVNDFLDISRLESGAAPVKWEKIDLKALVSKAENLFTQHPSGAKLAASLAPDALEAWGDSEQVYRVFINLCGNALKYSPAKGTVAIETRRAGKMIEASVIDQGPGLPPQAHKRLFEKFFRAGDEVSRKTPGTGLGLAICRSIVDSHGGSIWATNVSGGGARFTFTIPAEMPK
jgi:PAS domain S-box-containing protein